MKQLMLGAVIAWVMSAQAQAGAIFFTGHDSDEHQNGEYMSAGLDYLAFGQAADNKSVRNPFSVAVLNDGLYDVSTILDDYGWDATYVDVTLTGWENGVFGTDAAGDNLYDFVFVGSGKSSVLNTQLVNNSARFVSYFNNDGGIYINTDEGFGHSWYDFVPFFGNSQNNKIGSLGIFTPTSEGLSIGLTDAIVDRDITHSYYTGVDTTLFTVLEIYNVNGAPVALGLRGATIENGGYDGGKIVAEPGSLALIALGLVGIGLSRRSKGAGTSA